MPLYEYRCGQCGHEVEVLRKVSDQSAIACPSCGATEMHKKVTAAGFQLKGTGWYATDFRNPAAAAPARDKTAEAGAAADTAKADAPQAAAAKPADSAAPAPAPAAGASSSTPG